MTLIFDGAGGVFDRIGALYRMVENIRLIAGASGTAAYWNYELNDLYVKLENASNPLQASLDVIPSSLVQAQAGAVELAAACKDAAQTILIEMCDADDPLPERTVEEALRVLVAQMIANSEDVAANTVSASVTDSAATGDGVLIASVKDKWGRTMENVLAEDVLCQRDENAQQFLCRGEEAAESKLAVDWPRGSGASETVDAVDAADETLLTNGHFNDFTVANTPDDWSIVAGSAGTQILSETTNKLAGDRALEFVGNATGAHIRQDITAQVERLGVYAFNLFYKLDVDPAAGVLTVDLYDGSSVINDEAGTANSVEISLPGVNDTNWHALSGFFRLPDPLPATVYLRIRLSTALSVGSSVFIDQAALVEATRLYDGGPYLAAFIGGTDFAIDDYFTVAVANNRSSLYQEACDVFFDTLELDVRIPTDGSPSITNSFPSYEGT